MLIGGIVVKKLINKDFFLFFTGVLFSVLFSPAWASLLKVGDDAPTFKAKTHQNSDFDLRMQKGRWTILYFYPKADTPGCTAQAKAFKDHLPQLQELKADVFGVSSDNVQSLQAFHQKYQLNFILLADPDLKIIKDYGVQMGIFPLSKRWTFIIDPQLKIRHIDQEVGPENDPLNALKFIKTSAESKAEAKKENKK